MVTGKRRQTAAPRGARALLACLAIAMPAWLAGCGRDEEPEREITVSHIEGPASLDPAYAYDGEGSEEVGASEPLSLVYTPLLTYRHAPGEAAAELIPGLANDLPEVSDDGLTYKLTLRQELEYPNGISVRASDFAHTVKRVLTAGTPAVRLLEGIEGVEAYLAEGDPGADIDGIETDERTGDIVIRLAEPDAAFANVLAMWFLGMVPRNTQFRDRSESPPPGVGAYEIVESEPGERFVLERSESFLALDIPDIPTGNVDLITVEVGDDRSAQAEGVLESRLDYMRESPPPEVKSMLLSQAEDRYMEHPAPATYLFLLDATTPPFDDPAVREAANLALDKRALARAFDGELEPGCTLLPPSVPGYDEDFATTKCPYGDPSDPPDEAPARQLVARAGAEGAQVVVAGSDEPGVGDATAAFAEMLDGIGLAAEPRLLPREQYLRRLAREEPLGQATFMSVFLDFPHPLNAFSHVVAGAPGPTVGPRRDAILDETVSAQLDRLNREPDVDEVAEQWAALDRYVVLTPRSYIAPFGHPRRSTFVSDRIDPDRIVFHPVFLNDYSTFVLDPDVEG